MSTPTFLGLDLETTGLDERHARVIEVGIQVLDENLATLAAWSSVVACPRAALRITPDMVIKMHLTSGLFVELDDTGCPVLAELGGAAIHIVEDYLCSVADMFGGTPPILAGHSIQFDRRFLARWMPAFEAKLSHRQLDARNFEIIAPDRSWPDASSSTHRALPDLERSVSVLRMAQRIMVGVPPVASGCGGASGWRAPMEGSEDADTAGDDVLEEAGAWGSGS